MDTPALVEILKILQTKGALNANDLQDLTGLSPAVIYRRQALLIKDGLVDFREGTRPLSVCINQKGIDHVEAYDNKCLDSDPNYVAKREAAINTFLYPPEVRCE